MKILFRACNFFTFISTFQWTSSEVFFLPEFLAEGLRPFWGLQPTKTSEKDYSHSKVQFFAKKTLILRTSTHLTLKRMCSENTADNLSHFPNFPANRFLLGVRKSICTTPFLDAQELDSWSTWMQMCAYFCMSP